MSYILGWCWIWSWSYSIIYYLIIYIAKYYILYIKFMKSWSCVICWWWTWIICRSWSRLVVLLELELDSFLVRVIKNTTCCIIPIVIILTFFFSFLFFFFFFFSFFCFDMLFIGILQTALCSINNRVQHDPCVATLNVKWCKYYSLVFFVFCFLSHFLHDLLCVWHFSVNKHLI